MPDDEVPLHQETLAIRSGRRHNDTSLAPVLWPSTTYVTPSVDESLKMATAARPPKFYSRNGSPTVQRVRGRDGRHRRGRGRARVRLRHGRDQLGHPPLLLDGRPRRGAVEDVLGDVVAVHDGVPPVRASTSRSSTAPTPTRSPRPCGRARRARVRRDAGEPRARPRRPRRGRRDPGPVHGRRLDVRARRSCSGRSTTASTS